MPHSGAMLLIDRVIDHGQEFVITELDVGPRLPFFINDRVPAYLGIEIMAQSIAAWSGICRGDPESRPPIGFLLGTRSYISSLRYFSGGCILKIHAHQILENEGLAMFECKMDQISANGSQHEVAMAKISVFSVTEELNSTDQ